MPSLPIDDENLPLFTVGQVSAMLEIQQAFLRRLDRVRRGAAVAVQRGTAPVHPQ